MFGKFQIRLFVVSQLSQILLYLVRFWDAWYQFKRSPMPSPPPPPKPTANIQVFICREWSPTIVEIWDASGKQKRSGFSGFISDYPRWSGMSAITCFHKSVISCLRNPGSSEIFKTNELNSDIFPFKIHLSISCCTSTLVSFSEVRSMALGKTVLRILPVRSLS